MFSLRQDALLLSLRPVDEIRLAPEADDRRVWKNVEPRLLAALSSRAEQASYAAIPQLLASDRARYEDGRRIMTERREQLKALVLGACAEGGDRYVGRIADLMTAILEESDWAIQPGDGYPDAEGVRLDVHACETGALVMLSACMLRRQLNALSPRVNRRVSVETERRLIEPLVNREGDVLLARDEEIPRAIAALMTVTLLGEREDRRRWLCLRRLLRLLESYLNDPNAAQTGLAAHLERSLAVGDCFAMLGAASGGEVELRDEALFVDMARVFVCSYVGDGWFINPGGMTMKPELSSDQLFRLGESARLNALCALAACLLRGGGARPQAFTVPSEPLLQQVMAALGRMDLIREPAREARPEAVELKSLPLLAARTGDFYAAITGVGNQNARAHLDVGDIAVFFKGEPVIIDIGENPDAHVHSVPVVNGQSQRHGLPGAKDAECRQGPGYRMLSMNIAPAYPPAARLIGYQRTLMMMPFDGVRLMDVFDFDGAPGTVTFSFLTPHRPQARGGMMAIGPVTLSYEADLSVFIAPVPLESPAQRALWGPQVYRLEFSMSTPATSGNYAFVFQAAETPE